jgi:photosystem II stability/assembly factor-like uncharacterized protein
LIDERLIFDRFHEALDVPVPAGAFDRLRIALERDERTPRRRRWLTPRLRLALQVAIAILVLAAIVVALVGVLVAGHRPPVPPHGGQVTFPTKIVSATTGWAEVNLSEIWRTTDAGASWREVDPPTLPDQLPVFWGHNDAADFLDAQHAWVIETGRSGSGLYISVFGTADGGQHWRRGQSIPLEDRGGTDPVLDFIDARHGWLVTTKTDQDHVEGPPTLYVTSDGGLHWVLVSTRPTPLHGWCGPVAITFVTIDLGWLQPGCSEPRPMLVTRDGGLTWHEVRPQPASMPEVDFEPPIFFSPTAGMLISGGAHQILLMTSDAGLTWSPRLLPESNALSLSFVDAKHGWAIGRPTKILPGPALNPRTDAPLYRTDDGGMSWSVLPTDLREKTQGYLVGGVDFVDEKNGFASATDLSGPRSLWLKTSDGGRTWSVIHTS